MRQPQTRRLSNRRHFAAMDRLRRALLGALAACAATGAVAATGLLDRAEDATVDERFALRETLHAPGPPRDVVVVGIDDASFRQL